VRSYFFGVTAVVLTLALAPPFTPVAYFGVGWWLSRRVSRNVIWLKYCASVAAVARWKWQFITTWLWSTPRLIVLVWFSRSA
jgi:hypothetical protein